MFRLLNLYVSRRALLGGVLDVALVFLAILAGVLLQVGSIQLALPLASAHAVSLAAGLFVINTASGFYEQQNRRSFGQSCARAGFALALALPLTFALFSLLPAQFENRDVVQWSALVGVAAVIVRRVYVSHGDASARTGTRVVIFGTGAAAADVGRTLLQSDPHINIIGYVPGPNEREPAVPVKDILQRDGSLCDLAFKHNVEEIVVALTERRAGSMPLRELLDCKLSGVKVYDISTHFEKTLGQINIEYLNAGWMIFGDGFNQGGWRTAVKRVFDIICALVLLLVSAPVMLLSALLIKLESPGPLLYKQERVGQNNTPFNVVKFRSMRTDAEKDGKPRWATANDDRVTRIGKIIRKTRIDELPQLFNVLSGEMSLVGPRPERPFFVDQLTQEIPYFAVRHSVKPGVTGWAQVRYPYGATVEDSQRKLQFDLFYVKNHSLFLDIVILVETVVVVLTARGAR
jgi:sugar transferase (PEP-CTERM system associated)